MAATLRHSSLFTWRNFRFLVFRGVIQSVRQQQNSYKCYSASRREFGLLAGLKWSRDSRLLPSQNNFLPPRGKLKIMGLSVPRLSDQYMKNMFSFHFVELHLCYGRCYCLHVGRIKKEWCRRPLSLIFFDSPLNL